MPVIYLLSLSSLLPFYILQTAFPRNGKSWLLIGLQEALEGEKEAQREEQGLPICFLAVIISVFPAAAVGFQLLSHHSPSEEPTVAGVDAALSSKV